jgi:hypothetical protein
MKWRDLVVWLLPIAVLTVGCAPRYELPIQTGDMVVEPDEVRSNSAAILVDEQLTAFRWIGSPDGRSDYSVEIPLGSIVTANLAAAARVLFAQSALAIMPDQVTNQDIVIIPRLLEVGYSWAFPDRMTFPITMEYLVASRHGVRTTGAITSVATTGDGTLFATIIRSARWQDSLSASIGAAIQHTLLLGLRDRNVARLVEQATGAQAWSAEQLPGWRRPGQL